MVEVMRAGIDTAGLCWYVPVDSPAGLALDEMASVPTKRGYLLPDSVGGQRVGWNRGAGMLWTEGHPSPEGLCAAADFPASREELVKAMVDHGIPVPPGVSADLWELGDDLATPNRQAGFAGVRRLDTTLDLCCPPAEGLAVLAGVAAVARDAARVKAQVRYSEDGTGVETVYFHGPAGRKVLSRWYDKGREAGIAPPGGLVRPEDQRWYAKGMRREVEEFSPTYVRGNFQRKHAALYKASKGVIVAGPIVLAQKLAEHVEQGELSAPQAHDLAGFLLMDAVRVPGSRATAARRRAAIRELGLVLADGVLQEVEVNLHDVLEQCMDASAWGCPQ
jgi:hypothetical protein